MNITYVFFSVFGSVCSRNDRERHRSVVTLGRTSSIALIEAQDSARLTFTPAIVAESEPRVLKNCTETEANWSCRNAQTIPCLVSN